jgi:hypothetical protein
MIPIVYKIGDATDLPINKCGDRTKHILIHCCNDIGLWGAGFVLAIDKISELPKRHYFNWYNDGFHLEQFSSGETGEFTRKNLELGEIQICKIGLDIPHYVCNMIGQHGVFNAKHNPVPIKYDAIDKCLGNLMKWIDSQQVTIHAPKFGSGLAHGEWNKIEPLIIKHLSSNDVPVFVYTLE